LFPPHSYKLFERFLRSQLPLVIGPRVEIRVLFVDGKAKLAADGISQRYLRPGFGSNVDGDKLVFIGVSRINPRMVFPTLAGNDVIIVPGIKLCYYMDGHWSCSSVEVELEVS
jgi:hypothetical protein